MKGRRRLVQLVESRGIVKAREYSVAVDRAVSLRNMPRQGTYVSVTFAHALAGCWRVVLVDYLRGVSYFKAYGNLHFGACQVVPVYRVENRRALWASILDIRARLTLQLLAEGEEEAA